jgi:hypothetical protein
MESRDSSTVWLDLEAKDPRQSYKMFRSHRHEKNWKVAVHFSADGIHWSDIIFRTAPAGDRTTAFYNPFRKVWVYSLRSYPGPRGRRYWESPEITQDNLWRKFDEPPYWTGADRLDPQRADLKTPTELYNLDGVAYESLLLGLFTIWRGQPRDRQKPNEVVLGYSRDGWSWHRPDRRAFCPVSDRLSEWNACNVQSAGGGCLVVGDKLYFYVSGRAGVPNSTRTGVCSTGLAVLRRDGFASLDAGDAGGELTTRPVRFRGKHLFVNADAGHGELRAEILDEHGKVIAPFARADCAPVTADKALQAVAWKSGHDLSALAGKPVKLRFSLRGGKLYSFWISPEASGASHGYVAAGGPGFTGPTDTAGAANQRS